MFRGDGRRRQTRVKKQRAEKQREGGGAMVALASARKTGCGKMLRPGGLTRHDPAYETTAAPLHSTILYVRTRTCGCLCAPPPGADGGNLCVRPREAARNKVMIPPPSLFCLSPTRLMRRLLCKRTVSLIRTARFKADASASRIM